MTANNAKDLIIIGGGIGGVVCLYYAKKAGLNALLLERENVVGGLWARLPAWQDIQQTRFDWTLGDIPIEGEDQANILRNIQAWVDKFALSPSIQLDTPVTNAKRTGFGWELTTLNCKYVCKNLVAATGSHNNPVIPQPLRAATSIREYHSSMLRDPGALTGKDVLVVGGGASAFDLLDLCFEHDAHRVHWVYRSLRWMAPTKKPKHISGAIRWLAKQQMLGVSVAQLNRAVNDDLRSRYEGFGLNEILPEVAFDFDHDQLIPGRYRMIENFDLIERHRAEVSRISDSAVELSSGESVAADIVLWGTGYAIDLTYFEQSNLASITRADVLAARCGSKFLALDAPNLFFLAPGILDSTGGLAWQYAHASMAIVSHMQGKSLLKGEPVLRNLNYFDQVKFLAEMDPGHYTPDVWPARYEAIASALSESNTLPIP